MNNGLSRFEANPQAEMTPSGFTPEKAFTTNDKTEINHCYYQHDSQSEDDSKLVGVWECAPSREEIESYPVNEMMTVVSWSVTVTEKGRKPETFTTGDTFL